MDGQATEHGARWWFRYVVVPIIGGGGIVSLIVAWIGRVQAPLAPSPSAQQVVASTPATGTPAAPASAVVRAQDGIVVNQQSASTKGELTGVNARNLDPSSLPNSIEVTQKVDTVEGIVTGVDLSKKTQQGK